MLTKLKSYWPALLLIPAILSLFWPALLQPAAILFPTFSPFSDLMVIHWPKAHLMAQTWQSGQGLPYWTPLILSGMPLAANQLAMLFYPPAWLFLFLPLEPVFNFLFIFHFLLGGIGIFILLCEYFQLSPSAAFIGGLTFALNSKWLAHAAGGHVSLVGAIGWMPWTVLGVHMLLIKNSQGAEEQGSRGAGERSLLLPCSPANLGWIILIAVSLAMQIVTHTLPVIYSVYLILAMVAWHALNERMNEWAIIIRSFAYSLIRLFPGLILAGLLGAVQLLPLLELAQFSNRALTLAQATEFALSPVQLVVSLLLPSTRAGHELIIYAGLVPWLLAFLGLTRWQRWSWFYGLLVAFAMLFAVGPANPLHILFYYLVPGFGWIRTPARIFLVGALALAILAGLGAERLTQANWSPAAKKWLLRATLILAPLALFLGLGLAVSQGQASPIFRSALALALFLPGGLLLILGRAQRLLSAQLALTVLTGLLFLDLAWFDSTLLRFVTPAEALAPGRAAAAYLAQQPGYFRVYSPSYSLPMPTAAAANLALADGVEPVHLARYDEFMARAGGYDDPSFSVTIPKFGGPIESSLQEIKPNLSLLSLLNVTYLAAAFPMEWPGLSLVTHLDGVYIYRNQHSLPRAWVAHQTRPTQADWLGQLEALSNPGDIALVESPANNVKSSTAPVQPSNAEITYFSANHIELETQISQPGWLVLSEIWYPGWQASVNGQAQPVERVNGLLRGVYLAEAGHFDISLSYMPQSLRWGSWISGPTLMLLFLLGIWTWWYRKPC
jgi:hypothetical protein